MKITKFMEDAIIDQLPFIAEILEDKGILFKKLFEGINIFNIELLDLDRYITHEVQQCCFVFDDDNKYLFLDEENDINIIEFIYINNLDKLNYVVVFSQNDKSINIYKTNKNKDFLKNEIEKRILGASNFFKQSLQNNI